MFGGGSPGLLGEENKPKLFPPMSREPEFEGTGDESWAVASDVGSGRGKAAEFWLGSNRETEKGTSVREKERDEGKGVARSEKTTRRGHRR